jgi:hypothetical protein
MKGSLRRARDPDLLDQLDAHKRLPFEGIVWRVVSEGRNPVEPSRAGGRWDLDGSGGYDVLYTALEADGAVAEVEYHLSLQPVFPYRIKKLLYKLQVRNLSVLRIETLDELVTLGVDRARYHQPLYDRTQEIGDATAFLGCNGLIAPSARWDCLNLILFDVLEPDKIETIGAPIPIDWKEWRGKHTRARKTKTIR